MMYTEEQIKQVLVQMIANCAPKSDLSEQTKTVLWSLCLRLGIENPTAVLEEGEALQLRRSEACFELDEHLVMRYGLTRGRSPFRSYQMAAHDAIRAAARGTTSYPVIIDGTSLVAKRGSGTAPTYWIISEMNLEYFVHMEQKGFLFIR